MFDILTHDLLLTYFFQQPSHQTKFQNKYPSILAIIYNYSICKREQDEPTLDN